MKRLANLKKRSGFTLVELLIVIIIIGILAGAMLLVAGSGTDSAEATKIISNLRSLKSAALLYYADNTNPAAGHPDIDDLRGYMDRDMGTQGYEINVVDGWSVGYTDVPAGGVRGKLEGKAKELALSDELHFRRHLLHEWGRNLDARTLASSHTGRGLRSGL